MPSARISESLSAKPKIISLRFEKTRNISVSHSRLAAIGPEFKKFHNVSYGYHNNITKFISYYLRELIKSNLSEEEKNAAVTFYIYMNHLIDNIRYISGTISKYGCTHRVKQFLSDIFDMFHEQFKMLNETDICYKTILKRCSLKKKIDSEPFTVREYWVMSEAPIFLDTINEF